MERQLHAASLIKELLLARPAHPHALLLTPLQEGLKPSIENPLNPSLLNHSNRPVEMCVKVTKYIVSC